VRPRVTEQVQSLGANMVLWASHSLFLVFDQPHADDERHHDSLAFIVGGERIGPVAP